jgi:hypothetical protein
MDDYDRILSREVAKNTGMIIPYSAGLKKCYENFINISKKNDISVSMESKKIYIEYYNFIKKKIDNDFFYLNKMDDLKKIAISNLEKTREHIEETETGAANFEYNKLKTITFDINISNIEKETPFKKRITKIMKIPSKALDYKQTKTAFNANKIHFYDSDKLRIIENKFNRSYITIHDAYLIDFNNCSNLIIYLNESYNKKIKTNYIIDSIFPVI